jgi:hypothetical protein
MAKLTDNTVVAHPDTGAPTVLLKGDDVPDWAKGLVGNHLVDVVDVDDYDSLTVPDLRAEIDKRNADREDDAKLSTQGNKPDLVATLEADDAE